MSAPASTPYAIFAMAGEECYSIFAKDTQIPCEKKVILYEVYTVKNNARIRLFKKDGIRQFYFGVAILNEIPGVHLSYPLELTFRIQFSGMLEVIWDTESAKLIYDPDNLDLGNWVRRNNLRV